MATCKNYYYYYFLFFYYYYYFLNPRKTRVGEKLKKLKRMERLMFRAVVQLKTIVQQNIIIINIIINYLRQ